MGTLFVTDNYNDECLLRKFSSGKVNIDYKDNGCILEIQERYRGLLNRKKDCIIKVFTRINVKELS